MVVVYQIRGVGLMSEIKNKIGLESAKSKRSSGICYVFALPALFLILIFRVIPFMWAIILPFKEYNPVKGLVGSSWVGMDNFGKVFGTAFFPKILGNTLILKFEYILICGLIALVLAMVLSLIGSRKLQKFFSALFLLPYFIPTAVFSYLVLYMMSMEGPGFLFLFHTISLVQPQSFRTAYIAIEVVKNIGIPVAIALGVIYNQTSLSDGRSDFVHARLIPALKAIGLFALIQLSALLTTDFELLNSFYNPAVYEAADTLDTYSYRAGLLQSQYGAQAVVWLVQFIVQLLLSIPVYLLIKNFFAEEVFSRRSFGEKSINTFNSPAGSAFGIVLAFLAALLLFLPLILSFTRIGGSADGAQGMMDSLMIGKAFASYIPITLLAVIINVIVTALLAYPLTVHNLPGKRVYKIFLIVVLSIGSSGIHDYLFYRSMGAINTYIPYIFTGVFTIVNVFVLKAIYNGRYTNVEERTVHGLEGDGASFFGKYLPGIWKPLLGLAGLQFITIWNSYAPSQLWYMNDSSKFSPVMIFTSIMKSPQGEAYKALALQTMKIGFWVSLPSLIIGILLVAFIGHEIFTSQIRKV